MFKYKREVDNLNDCEKIEYSFSDNSRVCFCTTGMLKTVKPYHGMYIRNGKVLLENIVETFDLEEQKYEIVNIDTAEKELCPKEYILNIDLEKNLFEYGFGEIEYAKRYAFEEKSGILFIEYNIKNKGRKNAMFRVTPLITYREFFNMKDKSQLNFNHRETENGIFVALSVLNQENLVFKSDTMMWKEDITTMQNVVHGKYQEDLQICGFFEKEVKGFSETKLYVYIASKEFKVEDINNLEVFNNIEIRNKNVVFNLDENFVELIDLSKSILNTDMEDTMVAALPYRKEYNDTYITTIKDLSEEEISTDIDELIDICRSMEGQFIYYKKIKQYKKNILLMYKIIKEFAKRELKDNLRDKYNNLRLWYIEAVNRILQKECRIELYIDSIKEILFELIEPENRITCFNNIETTALMLNAIKIYLNILSWIGDSDKQFEIQEEYFEQLIVNNFWLKDKNIMKKNVNETESFANIEMLYTLSLSFPCVKNDIPKRILDSVFKELYTPYGIRKVSKASPEYDGLVYPKYMAHFIKANLRLAGITRASQKISYNLVKELIQDVGKDINGGIRKVYSENGAQVEEMSYDTLTNAEMVRLYNMFM